jgi:hypothetical protein
LKISHCYLASLDVVVLVVFAVVGEYTGVGANASATAGSFKVVVVVGIGKLANTVAG